MKGISDTFLVKLATYFSVTVAIILIIGKSIAWKMTSSVSLQASLIDSLLDGGASLINLFAVRHALKPADAQHRFGHGKVESLAGLAQAAFIAGSAIWLIIEALGRISKPEPIESSLLGTSMMVIAIVMTLVLVAFQKYVVKKTKSIAIKADALHYQTDVLTNIGVIIAINITLLTGWLWLDSIMAIAIAAYILITSWDIAKESLDVLMDHELPLKDRRRIKEIALSHKQVLGLYDLKTRSSGNTLFIQMNLQLPDTLSFVEAHEVAHEVMAEILREYPKSEIILHKDPVSEQYRQQPS